MKISRPVYDSLLILAVPFAMGYLLKRAIKQPEYKEHWSERFGFSKYSPLTKGKKRIWIHGVSVGETRASFRLAEGLLEKWPDIEILYTHTTPTGREVGRQFAERFPGRVLQSYLPYDISFVMKKFIAQTQPSICLLMETEVWPNLTFYAKQAKVPVVLVNGRLSERSLKETLKVGSLLTDSMARLTLTLAQSQTDAQRLEKVGCKNIRVLGNLKFDFVPNEKQLEMASAIKKTTDRKVVLLASTRQGEEIEFFEEIKKDETGLDNVIWVVVPRHPQRFDEVFDLIVKKGFSVKRRSIVRDTSCLFEGKEEVILGDSMGEMSLYYGLSDVALMGGSFGNYGSQSPIEACALGVPLIVGPSSFNFETVVNEATEANAIIRVKDTEEAINQLRLLLSNPQRVNELSVSEKKFFDTQKGATDKTIKVIEELLIGEVNDK